VKEAYGFAAFQIEKWSNTSVYASDNMIWSHYL